MLRILFALLALLALGKAFYVAQTRTARNAPLYMGTAPKPSGLSNTKEGKAIILERTKKLLDTAQIVITLPFSGVSKENTDFLRKEFKTAKVGTKASIVKNAIMRKAVENTSFAAINTGANLKEENMYLFIPEGDAKPTYEALKRWQKEYKRNEDSMLPKSAVLENTFYGAKQVEAVTKLPTKKELITKIAQGIKAVPTKIGRGINAVPNKLGRAFGALRNKLQDEADGKTA